MDRWTLIFFGFTHCPDICPTTMAELAELKSQLAGTEASDARVVMVSVDPARDTPDRLAQYVPYFHPDFIGVTGEFAEILSVAQRLNAPFRKVSEPDGGYQMEHSANVMLMNPRGDYHGFFRAPLDIPKMRVTLRSTQYLRALTPCRIALFWWMDPPIYFGPITHYPHSRIQRPEHGCRQGGHWHDPKTGLGLCR